MEPFRKKVMPYITSGLEFISPNPLHLTHCCTTAATTLTPHADIRLRHSQSPNRLPKSSSREQKLVAVTAKNKRMVVTGEHYRSRINQKKRRAVRNLDQQQISLKDSGKKMNKEKNSEGEGTRAKENNLAQEESNALPSLHDKLREELSCPICLKICYEPTSLWCGHSFCIRCLRHAVNKFGNKCPKCQQFIRKGQPYILNIVIWNTIQLLFSQEVVAVRDLNEQQISPKDSGKNEKEEIGHLSYEAPTQIETQIGK